MAYVDFDGATALAASQVRPLHEKLPDDFLQRYCGKVIDGTRHLTEWLKKL
jgi:aspartate aminotransferase